MPLNDTEVGEFELSLMNEAVPEEAPPACGENVTLKGTFCPAATVTGNVIPPRAYPVPFQLADETVTVVFELKLPFKVLLDPMSTFPKSIVEVLTVRVLLVGVFGCRFDGPNWQPQQPRAAAPARTALRVRRRKNGISIRVHACHAPEESQENGLLALFRQGKN